jgi:hypothetical protein
VIALCIFALALAGIAAAESDPGTEPLDPAVHLSFNEGSGNYALDVSGNGNPGLIYGATRIEDGGCGREIALNGYDNYVAIPYTSQNHPEKVVTVSAWFYIDTYTRQVLISTHENGGYRLAFDDGNDLWWTVNVEGRGDVSVPVQHESIPLRQWHYVTGTYDGNNLKLYLDGVLRNQADAPGTIHYTWKNYVLLGAEAGVADRPDPGCPGYFRGGLDEVRIYNAAIPYGRVIEDKLSCSQEPGTTPLVIPVRDIKPCRPASGSLTLAGGESAIRVLSFDDRVQNGTWHVNLPPGSTLVLRARDYYQEVYPDAWYIGIADRTEVLAKAVAFPNTNNAPVKGVIESGNATVTIRYFDGAGRFPAQVELRFECISPPVPFVPQNVLTNPIIVIYSASWATLIAIVAVILWLHVKRRKEGK